MEPRAPTDTNVIPKGERRFADKTGLSNEPVWTKGLDESFEIGAMLRRVLRAMVRRASAGDLEALRELHLLEIDLLNAIKDAALGAHGVGYSWTEIAAELGVTRQAARQRFGPR